MNRQHWLDVERLFHEALALPPQRRPQFLNDSCAGNDALKHDVQSLLDESDADDFLEMLWDAGLDRAEYDAYYAIKGPDESSPRLFFQRREKSRPEHYPLHVDLLAKDREAEIERLTAAGATSTETKTAGERVWTVMRDPDANPFCLE